MFVLPGPLRPAAAPPALAGQEAEAGPVPPAEALRGGLREGEFPEKHFFKKQSLAIKSPLFFLHGKGGDAENSLRAEGERVAIRVFGWCKN